MNSKNYLVWGVVVLVVVLVGYYLVKGSSKQAGEMQNQSATTETASPTVATTSAMMAKTVIDYTDSGFSPKSVTVKVGDTVTWTNKSAKPMWIASAPHPTHTDLAGFDQLSSVEGGGTYSYTFTKSGSWKYHNHMNPSSGGVVVVQ